ncbi:flavodoxin family protein [Candidatus Bipolaricaulota bacterium]|nr:flavodoxin family protein [Candidatus Bipolaricaulota bacterium]
MNVVVLHGSAHIGGDTDTLISSFLEGIGGEAEHNTVHFRPIDMNIAHCRACGECLSGGGCVIDDAMQQVYPAFSKADVVVLGAPMFWGYMTSQLKTLFDRLEAIVSREHFGGKDFVLFVTYRSFYGSMVEWLQRVTSWCGSRCHALTCQTFDPETGRDVPIAVLPEKLRKAETIGQEVLRIREVG